MGAEKRKQAGVLGLIVALVVVLFGSLLFMGLVGWFGEAKITLDAEYICSEECDGEYMELTKDDYASLVEAKKSFVVFVDQDGCTTADRLRGYVQDWATETGVKVYRMMFSEVKESSLHEYIKYYPSVVLVDKGKVRMYLRADSDDDAKMYNDYNEFETWIKRWV